MITSQGPAARKRISALLLLFLLSLLFAGPAPACMILVPGSIISLFYYWSGSWLRGDEKVPVTIHIVRGGTLLRTLNGKTPLEFELLDEGGARWADDLLSLGGFHETPDIKSHIREAPKLRDLRLLICGDF